MLQGGGQGGEKGHGGCLGRVGSDPAAKQMGGGMGHREWPDHDLAVCRWPNPEPDAWGGGEEKERGGTG